MAKTGLRVEIVDPRENPFQAFERKQTRSAILYSTQMGERSVLDWGKILQSLQSSELCLPEHEREQRPVRTNHPNRQPVDDHLWLRYGRGRFIPSNRIAREVRLLVVLVLLEAASPWGRLIFRSSCPLIVLSIQTVTSAA